MAAGNALINRAAEAGTRALRSNDSSARKEAGKALDEVVKIAAEGLKKNPSCDRCAEQLVRAYLMQSYFGLKKNYDECLEVTSPEGLQVPQFSGQFCLVTLTNVTVGLPVTSLNFEDSPPPPLPLDTLPVDLHSLLAATRTASMGLLRSNPNPRVIFGATDVVIQ